MTNHKLPKSIRISIRRKKSELRKVGGEATVTETKIDELVALVRQRYTRKGE